MIRRALRQVSKRSLKRRGSRRDRKLRCELLEARQLLAVTISGLPQWDDLGARPLVSAGSLSDPDNQASGGVEAIAVSPVDRSVIFVGSVNGGIWMTNNGDRPYNGIDDDGINGVDDPAEQPTWIPLTDNFSSLAIGDLRFDPADATGQTVFAGTGSASSLGSRGGRPIGVMKTTDGGETWSVFPLRSGTQPRVRAILPTEIDGDLGTAGMQQVVLVGTVSGNQGLYRSIDGGETYTNISGLNGLPTGSVTDLLIDPNDSGRIFAGVVGQGVYRTDDGGQNWTAVSAGLTGTGTSTVIQLAAHPNAGTTRLYALVSGPNPAAFASDDGGNNWSSLAAIPAGFQSNNNGLYTGMASDQLVADPSDFDVLYIAKGYGNSPILYRYDPSGSGSWVLIDSGGAGGNTRPHVDARDLQFTTDAGGEDVLLSANDGGIYYMQDPQDAANQRWKGLHGRGSTGLGIMEFTNIAWDANFDIVIAGAQDNGTSAQNGFLDQVWTSFRGSDGGDVQVDSISAGANSLRYTSTQPGTGGTFPLRRHEFDSATNQVNITELIPADTLANFTPYFVPAFELNSVDPERLVAGGSGTSPVYELLNAASAPNAAGANWVAVPVGPGFTNVNDVQGSSFAVGGRRDGTDNPDVLVVGSGSGVFVRSTNGGTLLATPTPFPGGNVTDIVLDPEDWQRFFVTDGAAVYETTDAGTSWTDLTTAFPGSYNTRFTSLEFVPTSGAGTIVAGGNLGASRLDLADPDPSWRRLGAGVPNAPVWDLDYNASDDVLVAGTFGRGAFLLQTASLVANDIPILTVCGDDDYVNQDDTIRIVRNELNPLLIDVFLNNAGPVPDLQAPLALFEQINVFGVGGNDQLVIDVTNGLIDVPGGIRFDGDGVCDESPSFGYDRGFDTLIVAQTSDTDFGQETLFVGPDAGSGVHSIDSGTALQTIYFEELEPILTDVVANLDITAMPGLASYLQAANDVAVTNGSLLADSGRVEIDEYEPIEFKRKTFVTLDTGAGDDDVVIAMAAPPEDLSQLTIVAGLGDDEVTVVDLPDAATTTFSGLRVEGNAGDDRIDGSAVGVATPLTLLGGEGSDWLTGGAGADSLNGGAGDDVIQAGNPAVQSNGLGADGIAGDDGIDTLLITGTAAPDQLAVEQVGVGQLDVTLGVVSDTLVFVTLERVDIDAGAGADAVTLEIDDSLFSGVSDPADRVLAYTVVGDGPSGLDRLRVVDDGLGDTVIWRQNRDGISGSVAIAPGHPTSAAPPIEYRGLSRVDVTPLDAASGGTGSDGDGRLLVFKSDPFEANDSRLNARHLGAGATTNVDPTIDPGVNVPGFPADQDWYRFVAAETGVLDVQAFYSTVETLANGRTGLPGSGRLTMEILDAAGNSIASSSPAAGDARLTIPAVRNEIYFVRFFGATDDAINVYNFSVINVPAPVPQVVDLQAGSDSGRNDADDITNDTTPVFDIILDDDRFEEFTNIDLVPDTDFFVDVYNNGELLGTATFAGPAPGDPANGSRWEFTAAAGDLLEGHNNFISAAVRIRDRGTPTVEGRGELSPPLQVTLDTVAPATPTIAIDPATTDSGVVGYPATMSDRITNVTAPGFLGMAEADSIVRLFATGVDIGRTVAVPLDGDESFQAGQWNQTPILDLNADGTFPFDGYRQIEATAEDVAGNVSDRGSLDLMLDTQGPRVAGVYTPADPSYNLFGLKPDTIRPTPLINSISIDVVDFPPRDAVDPGFLNYAALFEAVAETPGHYQLVGDHNGIIDIAAVDFVADAPIDGAPATGTITLTFAQPLPDDRFTLTVSDTLVDPVGNRLDGESNASEPQIAPDFPSGDGQPGGSFVARFTVDSRAELGTWAAGSVYIDTNGNFVFDPEGKDGDNTNEDITYVLGYTSDDLFAGNFALAGDVANGFDKLAAYGRVGGAWRWLVDTDDDGVPNVVATDPANANGLPVAGEFDGDPTNGDEVGVYTGNTWFFDAVGHDFQLDTTLSSNLIGFPVVGDFDGDGVDDLGTWTDDTFMLDLSQADGVIDGQADRTFTFGFIGVRERPVAADMDGDGIDDLGLWVPDRAGAEPDESGEWYFLISGGNSIEDRIVPAPLGAGFVVDFTPIPFGNDLFAQFGDDYAAPIVGNFDPPVEPRDLGSLAFLSFQNPRDRYDVNDDGRYTPQDALYVINALNEEGARPFPTIRSQAKFVDPPYIDVTGDHVLSPIDALSVINAILGQVPGEGEAADRRFDAGSESFSADEQWESAVDQAIGELGSDWELPW